MSFRWFFVIVFNIDRVLSEGSSVLNGLCIRLVWKWKLYVFVGMFIIFGR